MGLTGIAPVLGALSLWGVSDSSLVHLCVLFGIGCFAHMYGFALNDVFDIEIDRLSTELSTRPLVRGTIRRTSAAWFAVACLTISFLLLLFFFSASQHFVFLFLLLVFAFVLATIYDVMSKKYPGMDLFVASAVFLLIVFGAMTVGTPSLLTWVVALVGGIQVVFMNMINGAIKDIDHDAQGLANTLAIRLGAMIHEGQVSLPFSFKLIGYGVEGTRSALVFFPFIFLSLSYQTWQVVLLGVLTLCSFFSIYTLFSVKRYERQRIRRFIGVIVIFMYATTPVMLSSLNPYIVLVAVVPPLWFIFSNLVLHKTVLEAKTM